MARKFIICNGELIIGNVKFHDDLLGTERERNKTDDEKSKVIGGGFWHYNKPKNITYFWGRSQEFGRVTDEQFNSALKHPSITNTNILFSTKEYFSDVLQELEENEKL